MKATVTPWLGRFGSMMTGWTFETGCQIVNFEGDMRHRLDQFGLRRIVPVALLLNEEAGIQAVVGDEVPRSDLPWHNALRRRG